MGYDSSVIDHNTDIYLIHINEKTLFEHCYFMFSNIYRHNNKIAVSSPQLPVKNTQIPALLIDQIETLIDKFNTGL